MGLRGKGTRQTNLCPRSPADDALPVVCLLEGLEQFVSSHPRRDFRFLHVSYSRQCNLVEGWSPAIRETGKREEKR